MTTTETKPKKEPIADAEGIIPGIPASLLYRYATNPQGVSDRDQKRIKKALSENPNIKGAYDNYVASARKT